MDFVSNEFQQSHEGSFFGKEKRRKEKRNLLREDFWGSFVCLYISQVCYRTLLNEREGWIRKSGQVRSGLAGHAIPTYIGTLPTLLVALLLHVYTRYVDGR